MTTLWTCTYPEEAVGFARAASGLPCVVGFTVETDGRLPCGMGLGEAVRKVDGQAEVAYFAVNCAHPDHILPAMRKGCHLLLFFFRCFFFLFLANSKTCISVMVATLYIYGSSKSKVMPEVFEWGMFLAVFFFFFAMFVTFLESLTITEPYSVARFFSDNKMPNSWRNNARFMI